MKLPLPESGFPDFREVLFSAVEKVNHAYMKEQSEALASIAKKLASQVRIDLSLIENASQLMSQATSSLMQAMHAQLSQQVYRLGTKSWKSLSSLLAPGQVFDQIAKTIPAATEAITAQAAAAAKWFATHEKWKTAAEEYAKLMIQAEWPPVLDIPSTTVYEIVTEAKNMSPDMFEKEITGLLLDFYDEKLLGEKLSRWKELPVLSRRYAILADIIHAHLAGNYNLSVPVTLIQMEGFIGDISSHKGTMKRSDVEKYLSSLFDNRAVASPFDRVKSLILQNVLKRFKWGDEIAATISRHAIVHGAATQYGTKSASLKCILLFDYLVYYYKKGAKAKLERIEGL